MKKAKNNNISIADDTNGRIDISSLPFTAIAQTILGEDYTLSLAFVEPEVSRELNARYRKIDAPTDVLSFPIEENEGEIIICPEVAEKKAQEFDRNLPNFTLYLFIHGCFHLKGYDHGEEMESVEKIVREKFNI